MTHKKAHFMFQLGLQSRDNDVKRQIVNVSTPNADIEPEVPDAVLDQVVGGLARSYADLAALYPQDVYGL